MVIRRRRLRGSLLMTRLRLLLLRVRGLLVGLQVGLVCRGLAPALQ